jgi:allophanate hydrolase
MSSFTFGVPDGGNLTFFGDSLQEQEYRRAIEGLQAIGGQPVEIDFAPFLEAGRMLFNGPVLAERLVDLTPFLDDHLEDLHPATRSVIANAAKFSAADSYRQQYRLRQVQRLVAHEFAQCDVLAVPTTGTIYRIAEVESDPIRLNANNGYYTYFANMLQLAAISVPASFRTDGLPFSICLNAPALREGLLRGLARRFHAASGLTAGATGVPVEAIYEYVAVTE